MAIILVFSAGLATDMGLHDIYEVRITRLTPDVQPEQQVEVIVNILNQK